MNETPRFDTYRHGIPDTLSPHRADPFDAAVPPIYQTSLFLFDSYKELEDVFAGRSKQPIYSRGDNPTVQLLERRIADMEGAEEARDRAEDEIVRARAAYAELKAHQFRGRARWRELVRRVRDHLGAVCVALDHLERATRVATGQPAPAEQRA